MAWVGEFELEAHFGHSILPCLRRAGNDVDVFLAEGIGDIPQQARAV
jgi:hypothetical protein